MYNTNFTLIASLYSTYMNTISVNEADADPCVKAYPSSFSFVKELILAESPGLEEYEVDLSQLFIFELESCEAKNYSIRSYNSIEEYEDTSGNITEFFEIKGSTLLVDVSDESDGEYEFSILVFIDD